MKHLESKSEKDFELYQVFMYNFLYEIILNILTKKSDKKIHTQVSVPKCFNTDILYAIDAHF